MSCFHLSKGAFGNKNGSWVLALLGWWKGTACLEVGLQRGFARETLGEPSTFQLRQTGHNTLHSDFFITLTNKFTDLSKLTTKLLRLRFFNGCDISVVRPEFKRIKKIIHPKEREVCFFILHNVVLSNAKLFEMKVVSSSL
jgi:hypothetical protein